MTALPPPYVIGQPKEAPETPALLVDLPALERHAARMAQTIVQEAGVRWPPHIKGLKSPALAHLPLCRPRQRMPSRGGPSSQRRALPESRSPPESRGAV
jgi:hypothetical protein